MAIAKLATIQSTSTQKVQSLRKEVNRREINNTCTATFICSGWCLPCYNGSTPCCQYWLQWILCSIFLQDKDKRVLSDAKYVIFVNTEWLNEGPCPLPRLPCRLRVFLRYCDEMRYVTVVVGMGSLKWNKHFVQYTSMWLSIFIM